MLTKTADGSFQDEGGRVVFFGMERFIRDIVEGDCCFICGAKPSEVIFNNEHVLPRWLLKRYGLFDQTIGLPNGAKFRYDGYKVPCCASCNSRMGEMIEQPVREIIAEGHAGVVKHLKARGYILLFTWFCLIYLKTHLKDRNFKLHANAASRHRLSEVHPWEDLHHIHCLARCFHTGAEIDAKAFGSLLVLSAVTGEKEPRFDYSDLSGQCTMLLRLDNVAFVAVLNDANFANFSFQNHYKKISGPLSPIQLREVMANMAYINEITLNRPRFCTKADFGTGRSWIGPAQPLEMVLGETSRERLGEIFYSVAREMIAGPSFPNVEETRRMVRNGQWGFFLDQNGEFIRNTEPEKKLTLETASAQNAEEPREKLQTASKGKGLRRRRKQQRKTKFVNRKALASTKSGKLKKRRRRRTG